MSQHLLAQHFQIWLEGLKNRASQRLSSASLCIYLNDEQNPNANVELLPFAHFIVSHDAKAKTGLDHWQRISQNGTPQTMIMKRLNHSNLPLRP